MKNIEIDIAKGKNGSYLRRTYGTVAKEWARQVLAKKDDDYATNLYLAHFASHTPPIPTDEQQNRYDLAREILERNIWQKPFSRASVVDGIPKSKWLEKVEKAIAENKHIPEETINEYIKLK